MMDDPRLAPIRRYENVSAMWGADRFYSRCELE